MFISSSVDHRRLAMFIVVLSLFCLLAAPALSQSTVLQGGPIQLGPLHDKHAGIDAAYRRAVAQSRAMGLAAPRALPNPILGFPLRLRPASKAHRGDTSYYFVDVDPSGSAKDFSCTSRSYEGHQGTDFVLFPFWWTMMDGEEAEIIAAAPGTIVDKQDGKFDRQCNGAPDLGNYVFVQQDDGALALYLHMKNGSVTPQPVGSRVAAGGYLGFVGASGPSRGVPHLHFELRSGGFGGPTVDPFAGLCGDRRTSWRHQAENTHTEILRVATHSSEPKPDTTPCSQGVPPNYMDRFAQGAKVWIAAYLRDQRPDTPVNIKILRPDGSLYREWTGPAPKSLMPLSYWFTSFDLPARDAKGRWTAHVTFDGKVAEHVFVVGAVTGVTKIGSSISPLEATATVRVAAKFRVTVRNRGENPAVGCTLAPDVPIAATWEFKPLKASPDDPANAAFDIGPGGRILLDLTILPKRGYRATQYKVPIRVVCNNAPAPASDARVNIVTLSF